MKVVIRPERRPQQGGLFSGDAWQAAATEYALTTGAKKVERWQLDQRFMVAGQWHRIEWDEAGECWRVEKVEG